MRFSSLAVAAFLLDSATNVSSFSVARPAVPAVTLQPQQINGRIPSTRLNFAEVSGGMEELQELTQEEDKTPLIKTVRKSPSFFKMAGYAAVPVSAALGFGLVPSRRLAAHAVGAVVTGVAGAVGKSRLDVVTESAATPAIAQALIDHGLDDPQTTASYVKAIQNDFGIVDDEEFSSMCGEVYGKYLLGMVKHNPQPKTSELKELDNLKTALALNNLHVGQAHADAATEWYRTTCLFTPEEDLDDPDHPDHLAMNKFLFLTERVLRQNGETDEAFRFEMTRVSKAMGGLKLIDAVDRVADVMEPFYQRALKSTRSKLGTNQVSSDMLERARQTLGVDEQVARDMHVTSFNDEVRDLLGKDGEDDELDLSTAKFGAGAKERVSFTMLSVILLRIVGCCFEPVLTHCIGISVGPTTRYSRFDRARRQLRDCCGSHPTLSSYGPCSHQVLPRRYTHCR